MGCWNHTCAISNLHVRAGQQVAVFLVAKNQNTDSNCYANSFYDPCPIPFYGEYDDYGGVENCYGAGLPLLMEELKSQLYEFGQGPNEYHDCEVNKDNFDITKLFEADHESRLGIQQHYYHNSDEYDFRELQRKGADAPLTKSQQFELDRLAAKIKKQDTFRQVTHIVIHGDILNSIKENWYIEDYVGDGNGTTGYSNSYNHVYFKDLIASIPEFIRRMQEKFGADESGDSTTRMFRRFGGFRDVFEYNDPCLAGQWIVSLAGAGSSTRWSIVNTNDVICDLAEAKKWDELAKIAEEFLLAAWVNVYMSYTRKHWTPQTGAGSQNSEPLGYKVLAEAVLRVLEEERKEYAEYEDDDEGDEATEG
jgi:hypothetical protein